MLLVTLGQEREVVLASTVQEVEVEVSGMAMGQVVRVVLGVPIHKAVVDKVIK